MYNCPIRLQKLVKISRLQTGGYVLLGMILALTLTSSPSVGVMHRHPLGRPNATPPTGTASILTTSLPAVQPPPAHALASRSAPPLADSPAALNQQGEAQLAAGQPKSALQTWQQAEQAYRRRGDRPGELGSQLNQARALQVLGFYRQAQTLLQTVSAMVQVQPDSELKLTALLQLGNVLRMTGELKNSQQILQQALTLAQTDQVADRATAAFSLGNTMVAIGKPQAALVLFTQAAAASSPVRLAAHLRQFETSLELGQLTLAQNLHQSLQTQLATAPIDQPHLYARLDFAESWLRLLQTPTDRPDCLPGCTAVIAVDRIPPAALLPVAQLLSQVIAQAQSLRLERVAALAWGKLGHVYELAHQWPEASRATRQAVTLAQALNAPDVGYQWQWQLGRIAVQQGDPETAITHYTNAFNSLQLVRQDLLTMNQNTQFSFREQVEPVYRELVSLLLQTEPVTVGQTPPIAAPKQIAKATRLAHAQSTPHPQQRLLTAREVIEALQLAQLANFFREACIEQSARAIDQIDPTAAIFYPIILPDRLEVILSLPGQFLTHYSIPVAQPALEAAISQMRQSLRSTSFTEERLAIAQQLYQWLVQPAEDKLVQFNIKTLVFALDGNLRNLPMAALHDGEHYLIEQYSVAVTPSLKLFVPSTRPLLSALVGGLANPKSDEFANLPAVQQEVNHIKVTIPATVLLDRNFTTEALQSAVQTLPISILHLATHGQFSSKAEDTFILTWNGRMSLQDINSWLADRTIRGLPPIDLLVLSACQTAQGDKQAALGLAGMAVRSGARSILASLWPVNDASTAQFMVHFYQFLLRPGTSKAEAARLAQLKVMQMPQYSHPYYWAPFILVGNWQ
jgi:CHAT domain-containing protein